MTANNLEKSLLRCHGGFGDCYMLDRSTSAADDGLSGWMGKCTGRGRKDRLESFLFRGFHG